MPRFQIPELTYPLVIDTIGKHLATGTEVSANCSFCHHHVRINLVALADRFGMNFKLSNDVLKKLFRCQRCRDAGRPGDNVTFIHHAQTSPSSRWPRDLPIGFRSEKA